MSVTAHTERPRPAKRRCSRSELAWRWAAAVLLGVVASIGCDPIQMLSFALYPSNENNLDPKFSLAIEGKESKIAIFAAHEELVPNLAFRDAHRDLCRRLSQLLEQRYKDDQDKIKVVPASQVLSYMDTHPDWITQSKQDLGKHFGADFVVFLELGPMTMYEKGSRETLYRGNVEINISIYDAHVSDNEGPRDTDVYTCTYPGSAPMSTSDIRPSNFKLQFMNRISTDLVQYFASHPSKEMVNSD
jgi:hypothetical protein